MQTHRFMQIDDLTTGQVTVCEMMAEDAARIYPPAVQALLALGKTVRIGDTLHCDLQAFLRTNRQLPAAMLRPPIAATAAAQVPRHAGRFPMLAGIC